MISIFDDLQAHYKRVASMASQRESPPEKGARKTAGRVCRNAETSETVATRLSARRHRSVGPLPRIFRNGYKLEMGQTLVFSRRTKLFPIFTSQSIYYETT